METLEDRGGGPKWHWDNVQADLRKQGLPDVSIDPLTTRPNAIAGANGDNRFFMTWVRDALALLTMRRWDEDVVAALARVLEYDPFCRYTTDSGLETIEWDKERADERLKELHADGVTATLLGEDGRT